MIKLMIIWIFTSDTIYTELVRLEIKVDSRKRQTERETVQIYRDRVR